MLTSLETFPRNEPCDADIATRRIEACTTDIKRGMTSHQLLLNETKTETIVFYARNARVPPAITTVDVCVSYNASADITGHRHFPGQRNGHVDASCAYISGCLLQLRNIANICHCLTIDACKTIVHGMVTSKLDYGNAVSCRINGRLLQKLQRVHNSAALVITQQRH